MTIRAFQAGDDAAQVGIYNEAAGELAKFKPATLDEVRRRCRAADFDPATRFYAVIDGRPVGYCTFQANGRISYPWCRRGHEGFAPELLEHTLAAMRQRGLSRAFAAYRGDWPAQRDFFLAHGFTQVREMVNFVADLAEMPTPAARFSSTITPLTPDDLPAVLALGAGVLKTADVAELERCLFHNRYFPPDALFALRSRADGRPVGVAALITNPAYANPHQLDAAMPCFRLGAFGTEGMTHKRVNGLFSLLAADTRELNAYGHDLLGHATSQMCEANLDTFAAQVPSDAAHLARFYKGVFRRQGSFPIYERAI
jgi:hypothetical protein